VRLQLKAAMHIKAVIGHTWYVVRLQKLRQLSTIVRYAENWYGSSKCNQILRQKFWYIISTYIHTRHTLEQRDNTEQPVFHKWRIWRQR